MNGSSVALDTNVAVHMLNGTEPFASWVPSFHRVFLPATVIGELTYGALNSHRATQNLQCYNQFIAACHVLDTTRDVATQYATLRLRLKRDGKPIPENDIWIAAACIHHDVPLATVDAHFAHIELLHILRPIR